MGIIGLIILILIVSFIGVTVMGWDNFLDLMQAIVQKFYEFVESGFDEIRERVA